MDPRQVFSYVAPVDLTFGAGTIAQLKEKVQALGAGRALVVTDPVLARLQVIAPVTDALHAAGVAPVLFTEVEENPKDTTCEAAVRVARQERCDLVVGVGGGSPMDVAKVVAVLLAHRGARPQDFEGRDRVTGEAAPLVLIPTTAGTAAEVTFNAVITDTQRQFKFTIVSRKLAPRFAILDPELTLSKPPGLTAATGIDALTHAVESYTNRMYNPIADSLSTAAIRLIGQSLRTAVVQGQDLQARSDMLLGSLLAGLAFNLTRVGLVHAMSHPLSAHFGTPHGVANALLLPRIMEYNLFGCIPQMAHVAALLGANTRGLSELEAARLGVGTLFELNRDVGIPPSLREVGADPARFPTLARDAMLSGNIPVNPRLVTEKDVLRLYQEAMEPR